MLPVWDDLEKSQIDDEKIEQAIARMISEHEADEEAHLGSGESLQSHKASEIIDHLAHSVVRDKLEFDRFAIDTNFDTLDGWDITGYVEQMGVGCVELYVSSPAGDIAGIRLFEGEGIEGQSSPSLNPVFETRVKFSSNSDQSAFIGYGTYSPLNGIAFKIEDNVVYAYYEDNTGDHSVSLGTLTLTDWHVFRIVIENGSDIYYYIDGSLAYSILSLTGLPETTILMNYWLKNNADATKIIYIQSLHYDADYVA